MNEVTALVTALRSIADACRSDNPALSGLLTAAATALEDQERHIEKIQEGIEARVADLERRANEKKRH